MLPELFIIIGILLNIVAYYFYIKDMFFGETKPNLVSWLVWALAPIIGSFFQLQAGAGWSALPIFMAGFGPLIILFISILKKDGYWKITVPDMVCGVLSILALVLYIATRSLVISIIFVILSDGLAAIPTIVKSWKFPETETSSIYISGIFGQIIGLLIIKNWIFPIYSLGIYFVLVNVFIVFSIYRKKILKTKTVI